MQEVKIGLLSVSDRAAKGVYTDQGLPSLKKCLRSAIANEIIFTERLVPDEQELISEQLIELTDNCQCSLVLTTGGTGLFARDVTPDATAAVAHRFVPGIAEHMRRLSLHFTPLALLSRQLAVTRHKSLIINLPGNPKAIVEILEGVGNDRQLFGLFVILPSAVDAVGGPVLHIKRSGVAPICS